MASHRILYAGEDLALLASLKDTLKDCRVVRSPGGVARSLIESEIAYSLLLVDGELEELASFARTLRHREQTPVITLPAGGVEEILTTVVCSLIRLGRRP